MSTLAVTKDNYFFDSLVQSVVAESNRIRADPTSYIPILEEYIGYFKDNVLHKPGQTPIETYEGPNAFTEAIKFLRKQKPLSTLTFDENITKAALDHVNDLGSKGLFSHEGTDGKSASERIDKYCEWEKACAENIEVGCQSGVDVIVSLLVDDGIEKKIHRQHLFREELTHFGVASGPHKLYETVVVIDYTGGIREHGKPFFDKSTYKYQYPADLDEKKEKSKKPKTSYQLQDEDAPDGTVQVKMTKELRLWEGRKNKVTRKYYTLQDGSHHVVEVEEL